MAFAWYLSTRTLNKYFIYTLDIAEHSTRNGSLGFIPQPLNGNERIDCFRSINACMRNKGGLHYINNLCDKW